MQVRWRDERPRRGRCRAGWTVARPPRRRGRLNHGPNQFRCVQPASAIASYAPRDAGRAKAPLNSIASNRQPAFVSGDGPFSSTSACRRRFAPCAISHNARSHLSPALRKTRSIRTNRPSRFGARGWLRTASPIDWGDVPFAADRPTERSYATQQKSKQNRPFEGRLFAAQNTSLTYLYEYSGST